MIVFNLMSILSDISVATPALSVIIFMELLKSFVFQTMCVLKSKMSSYEKFIVGSLLKKFLLATVCILIGQSYSFGFNY